jgi:hypothetical protein
MRSGPGISTTKSSPLKPRECLYQQRARTRSPHCAKALCRYDSLGTGIRTLYEDAKVEHNKGIELLVKAFNYHPMYRVDPHGFTGTPFRPK